MTEARHGNKRNQHNMEPEATKLTLNRMLDLIESLPEEKKTQENIQKLKQELLQIKFDDANRGFAGNIVLDNTEQLLKQIYTD